MTSQIGKSKRRNGGFTFLEVMVTVVILGIGLTGVYRAFLIALNYQQHVVKRLYILNFLSDRFSRAENHVIAREEVLARTAESPVPWKTHARFVTEFEGEPFDDEVLQGLTDLKVSLHMDDGNKKQIFRRDSYVYVSSKPPLSD